MISYFNPGVEREFPSSRQLERATHEIADLAREEGIRIALIGGRALQLRGSERLTKDLDFVADRMLDAPPSPVEGKITFGEGYKFKSSGSVEIDFIVRHDEYPFLYRDALDVAGYDRDRGYYIVPLPYIAAMKLNTGRLKDEYDLKAMLLADALDTEKTRSLIKKHMHREDVQDFDALVMETNWRAESGEQADWKP